MSPDRAYDLRVMEGALRPPTGHVFRVERTRGPMWYAKYRLPDGRQVQKNDRAGLDGARAASGWLLHQMHG